MQLQAGARPGIPNSDMWRAAAHNLELTEQQRKALCQLRRLFLQKQEALIAHRQKSTAALQLCVPNAASSHDIAAQFLKVSSLHRSCTLSCSLGYSRRFFRQACLTEKALSLMLQDSRAELIWACKLYKDQDTA